MRSKIDSLDFRVKHHYSQGFNFIVTADSLMLLRQQPEEAVNGMKIDSFAVKDGKEVVVADIRILPIDKQYGYRLLRKIIPLVGFMNLAY